MAKTGEPILPIGSGDLQTAAHRFHPPRLTLAREFRGLTKAELAERVQKTAAAIGQFEAGGKTSCRPDAKTLGAIALALGVKPAFFTRPSPRKSLEVDVCHFRSLRSASQRARRKLIARGSLLCDVLDVLEEHVELPREQVSSVMQSIRTDEDIENCAANVRARWGLGLGPIPNMVKLLEGHGVLVTQIPDGCSEVDAFSTWHEGRPVIFLVLEKDSTSRSRFDAAHELGHLVMHADVAPGNPDAERQAHRFASSFLLPRVSFGPECPTRLNWEHFYELKRRWRVSVAGLVKRGFDLGYITEASYRRAFMILNRTGERRNEYFEPPPENPTLIRKAIEAMQPDLDLAGVGERIGLSVGDVAGLIGLPSTTLAGFDGKE